MIEFNIIAKGITFLMECKGRPVTETMIKAWNEVLKDFHVESFSKAIELVVIDQEIRFPNVSDVYHHAKIHQKEVIANDKSIARKEVLELISDSLFNEEMCLLMKNHFSSIDEYNELLGLYRTRGYSELETKIDAMVKDHMESDTEMKIGQVIQGLLIAKS